MNMKAYDHKSLPLWRLILIAVNGACFFIALLLFITGSFSGPLVLLAIGTGLTFGAGLLGFFLAATPPAPPKK